MGIKLQSFDKSFEKVLAGTKESIEKLNNKIFERVKHNPSALSFSWQFFTSDFQQKKIDEAFELINNSSPDVLFNLWDYTHLDVRYKRNDLFPRVRESAKLNGKEERFFWSDLGNAGQIAQSELFPQIVKNAVGHPFALYNLYQETSWDVKQKYPELLSIVIQGVSKYPWMVKNIWLYASQETINKCPESYAKMVKALQDDYKKLKQVGAKMPEGTQENLSEVFLEMLEHLKKKPKNVADFWNDWGWPLQDNYPMLLAKAVECCGDDVESIARVVDMTTNGCLKKNIDMLPSLFDKTSQNPDLVLEVWKKINYLHNSDEIAKVQVKNFDMVKEILKDHPKQLVEVYKSLLIEPSQEVFMEIFEYAKKSPRDAGLLWNYLRRSKQNELREGILEQNKDYEKLELYLWLNDKTLFGEQMKKRVPELLNKYVDDFEILGDIIEKVPSDYLAAHYFELLEDQKFKPFLEKRFGIYATYDEQGKMMIPAELKKMMKTQGDEAKLLKMLPVVIQNWDTITKIYQLKKANAIVEGGLEYKSITINDVITIVDSFSRPSPQTASAEDFERTKGSEMVGLDTQYTASVETAVQRAHTLSEKIDNAGAIKNFADFSCESSDGEMVVKCLHPQDKRQILIGYETNCCFRPNGNADNMAKNEYSLLQYCTTTPYGGVLTVESKDKDLVYMGTPVLTNGNMMMFHSYETTYEVRKEETSELLVEAAKKEIESSNGSISIVFMTSLHDRLNIGEAIRIPHFFKAYTEGEYEVFKGMYTNLDDHDNIVLAAKVGDKVLTGRELVDWYKTECHENPEELQEKLGLYYGERNEEFDFGERNVKQELITPNLDLVTSFEEERDRLAHEKEVYSVALEYQKLQQRAKEDKKAMKELQMLKEVIKKERSNPLMKSAISLSEEELRNRIMSLNEQEMVFYSGNSRTLIQEKMGISDSDVDAEIRRQVERETPEDKTTGAKSAVSKKMHNMMMASVMKAVIADNEKKMAIRIAVQSDEVLSQDQVSFLSGIGVASDLIANYQEAAKKGMVEITQAEKEERRKLRVDQKITSLKKDALLLESAREKALASLMFPEVSTEEVASLLAQKHHLDVLNAARDEHEEPPERKVEDLSPKQRERMEQEVRVEKLRKIQAGITIGIDSQEKITRMRTNISKTPQNLIPCSRFVYGNDWYICADEQGRLIEEYVDDSVMHNSISRREYEESRSAFSEREEEQKKEGTISMTALRERTDDVNSGFMKKAIEGFKKMFQSSNIQQQGRNNVDR